MTHTPVTFGSIVLALSMCLCSSSGYAGDEKKQDTRKDPAAKNDAKEKRPTKEQPDKFEKYDLGEIDDAPPPELEVDPTLKKPAKGNAPRTGTRYTERAVTRALIWLADHQSKDGSWSLQNFTENCKEDDKSCTGKGDMVADSGATALGVLPFLAAGQTHRSKGVYKENIARGIDWLIKQQQADGNLAKGARQMMYSHGLATLALSEAYALTGDKHVGQAAQKGTDFIVAAQNKVDGGWRYNPGDAGDTSAFGWQMTALKSAYMAGLDLHYSKVFDKARKFLDSTAVKNGTEYGYLPGIAPTPSITAEGLLGREFLGAKREDPMLVGGTAYLMEHLPDEKAANIYYWYYGTQVMHNMSNPDWDTWNRRIRDILVRTQNQVNKTCACGSWDPAKDAWGRRGGRMMVTSLATLTLEVYYRYLPIFKTQVASTTEAEKK